MYISIINHHHPKTKYFITDLSDELNIPHIPEGYSFVFKDRYTNKVTLITNEKLHKLFKNNTLFFDIKLFNHIYRLNTYKFRIEIESQLVKYFNNDIGRIEDNNIIINNILDFTKLPNDYYTKNEIDNELEIISGKFNILKERISSLNEIAKKEEIENELNLLEQRINSLIS